MDNELIGNDNEINNIFYNNYILYLLLFYAFVIFSYLLFTLSKSIIWKKFLI